MMKQPPKTKSFIAAVAQFCVLCSLTRVSRQYPTFQSMEASMRDLGDDWAVAMQKMNNTLASISLAPTSQAPTAETVTQTAATEELKGSVEGLRDLLSRLPTLERCLRRCAVSASERYRHWVHRDPRHSHVLEQHDRRCRVREQPSLLQLELHVAGHGRGVLSSVCG